MIHRIRIQNFKSLVDVDVELSPVTVLVGRSGTGKSNFVEAIRFLRELICLPECLSPTRYSVPAVENRIKSIRPLLPPHGDLRFDITFSLPELSERFVYSLAFGRLGGMASEERLRYANSDLYRHRLNGSSVEWSVPPSVGVLWAPGPIAIGMLSAVPMIGYAYAGLTRGIACHQFSDDVLRNGSQSTDALDGFSDRASNYLFALRKLAFDSTNIGHRRAVESSLRVLNPSVESVGVDNPTEPTKAIVGHRLLDKFVPLPLANESDGFRRFLAHLLALYQRPSKLTLCFEHPEDGIHPGALSLLADELRAAPEDGRGQVILTTHSPQLLDRFDVESIRVVTIDGFRTRIGPVSPEQLKAVREGLLSPGELLTMDPARLAAAESTAS